MENFLVLGSSLARQVVQNSELCGKNIENILFKGKFDLCSIEKIMKLKNKTYITIFCLAGNDLLPTKLHKQNNKFHVCLDSFCLNECMLVYSSLIDILSKYTKQVIFVEPPPRATYVIMNSNCLFYDGNTAQRFRRVINSIKTTPLFLYGFWLIRSIIITQIEFNNIVFSILLLTIICCINFNFFHKKEGRFVTLINSN